MTKCQQFWIYPSDGVRGYALLTQNVMGCARDWLIKSLLAGMGLCLFRNLLVGFKVRRFWVEGLYFDICAGCIPLDREQGPPPIEPYFVSLFLFWGPLLLQDTLICMEQLRVNTFSRYVFLNGQRSEQPPYQISVDYYQ